jgi:hypothetical protein
MGEPVGATWEWGWGPAGIGRVANRSPARLDGSGESAVRTKRGGGGAPEHPAGPTVRVGVVAGDGRGSSRFGIAVPPTGPSPNDKRFLTPFFPPVASMPISCR